MFRVNTGTSEHFRGEGGKGGEGEGQSSGVTQGKWDELVPLTTLADVPTLHLYYVYNNYV